MWKTDCARCIEMLDQMTLINTQPTAISMKTIKNFFTT
ncbi:hypothetical protein MIZ01_0794 [Sideroxyarcus emersonii]|uniref:Uncharacterized protein n=1 Tax=Sideroxyarcus emersonii TaxID=2764705 RepID=A0AAN2BYD7_9PROT|nr:hypothetical protein MIZ01_0794 [Sideroxyarcus emersonii]